MIKTAVSLALLIFSFFISSWFLNALGISQAELISASRYSSVKEIEQGGLLEKSISVSDGGRVKVTCMNPSFPKNTVLRCTTKIDVKDWLLQMDIIENEDEQKNWHQKVGLLLTPRLSDPVRTETGEKESIVLSAVEKSTRLFPIVSISSGYRNAYISSKFEVGSEAVKALIASDVRTASEIYERELSRIDIERISELNAEVLEKHLGSFNVRKNLRIMVLQGPMEYIILSLGIGAVLLMLWGFGVTYWLNAAKQGSTIISQSSALGGSLTYLGLLGTLVGMFGTVIELSSIDFVNEMRKVFDQTGSFGSMALAIGTSVIGLTGSVIVWLSHILLSIITGRRIS